MATFTINAIYNATYSVEKVAKGFKGSGQIFKGNSPTKIRFSATGNTMQAAVNATMSEAQRVCPSGAGSSDDD